MAKRVRGATSTGPTGTPRAGRRERDRELEDRRPFIERYRSALVVVGALAIVPAPRSWFPNPRPPLRPAARRPLSGSRRATSDGST
jgi:hypothetical protein